MDMKVTRKDRKCIRDVKNVKREIDSFATALPPLAHHPVGGIKKAPFIREQPGNEGG